MRSVKTNTGPHHYIFIANSVEYDPHTTGRDIAITLADNGIWLASAFTPFRAKYTAGDRVLLYVAGAGSRCFVGDAEIADQTRDANAKEKALAKRLGLDGFAETIPLKSVNLWQSPVLIKPLVNNLAFIKDKINYGLNLRQAAVRVPESDYALIKSQARLR